MQNSLIQSGLALLHFILHVNNYIYSGNPLKNSQETLGHI